MKKLIRSISAIVVIVCVVLIVFFLFKFEIDRIRHQNACVELGYPGLLYSEFKPYCHKLENGNDVIVSLEYE